MVREVRRDRWRCSQYSRSDLPGTRRGTDRRLLAGVPGHTFRHRSQSAPGHINMVRVLMVIMVGMVIMGGLQYLLLTRFISTWWEH